MKNVNEIIEMLEKEVQMSQGLFKFYIREKMNAKTKKIVAVQYDAFWILTPEQAIEVLTGIVTGIGYNLPNKYTLRKPKYIARGGVERVSYFSVTSDCICIQPLDMGASEARELINEIKKAV
jgi:hypothetical protein